MNEQEITVVILRKMVYWGKWSGAHTSVDNLPKGFPKHLCGEVKEVAQQLIKKHFLLAKPTSYGVEVSLNPEMKKEIEKMTHC